MDVRNCRKCGRLYDNVGGPYRHLCPKCVKAMEELFYVVRDFIEENPGSSIPEVSRECGVSPQQIEAWVREERLFFSEDSPVTIACEQCGASIRSGRYCAECKSKMANNLNSAYGKTVIANPEKKLRDRDGARMRFLENK